MSGDERRPRGARWDDVRLRGFADRVSLELALGWIDDRAAALEAVEVGLAEAVGRVPAAALVAQTDLPPFDRAADDGYALRADETVGAGAYNPLLLELQDATRPLRRGAAALVAAGVMLPRGADAVLSFDAAHASGAGLEVIGTAPEGAGVESQGQLLRAGTALLHPARPLRPQDAALLAALGVERVGVVRRPRVRLLVAGPKITADGASGDASGPMLGALVARDGGTVEVGEAGKGLRDALLRAADAPRADLILAVGRTATGPDDEAPAALAEAGELAIHGIALRPGGSTGLGSAAAVPVILLPGDPLACLCAYELLAGRLLRRLGGRPPDLPHATREAEVGRKLVSAVGFVDMCQVRLVSGRVEPVGSADSGGLPSAVRADGFVLVPASLEGYAPGARVSVHIYS
jgi:molybdopterin molybdotransferase